MNGRARSGAAGAKPGGPAASGAQSRHAAHNPGNQALQSILRTPRTGPGPYVHQNSAADRVLGDLGAPGAAIGQNILLAGHLGGGRCAEVLRHEVRHTRQTDGRDANPAAPIALGSPQDRWERAAHGTGDPGRGGDPQVMRLYDPAGSTQPYGECSIDDPPPDQTDARTCDLDESSVLEGGGQPVTTMPEGPLGSQPENPICEMPFANASFDPNAVDVAGMRNDDLNVESIRVDTWINQNSEMSPVHDDLSAYRRLQQRLRDERNARVQTGHLWMTTAVDPVPDQLYMLQATSAETIIISVNSEFATGVPNESFPGPIMTRQQFDDHLNGLGIPLLTEEQYVQRLRDTALQIHPELLMPPDPVFDPESDVQLAPMMEAANLATPQDRFRGYTGQQGRLDARVQGIYDALPWDRSILRQGEIGEGFALHSLRGNRARAFDNAGRFWNTTSNPPVFGHQGRGLRLSASGVDPLRPLRGGWDTSPAVDIQVRNPISSGGRQFDLMSVKVSYRQGANRNTRYNYYLTELGRLGDAGRSNLARFQQQNAPNASLAETGARMALMIPEEHATDLRNLLQNPTGFEPTDGGGQSTRPNWAYRGGNNPNSWDMRPHFANAAFQTPINAGNGPPINNGADLLAALRAGRITPAQFDTHITALGQHLSNRVFGFDFQRSILQHYEAFRTNAQTTNPRDLHAGTPIEVLQIEEHHRRSGGQATPPTYSNRRGSVHAVAHRNALHGAGMNVGFSALMNLTMNDNADLSNPEYRRQLLQQLAVEGVANYGADFAETVVRSRVSYEVLEHGLAATAPRVVAGRLTARALPGVADVAIEGFSMLTDERENSVTEVIVRSGRAGVIGAGSAWAGAAAGTAVGGPIGFVVGFGVGLFVGWAANKIIPGGGEDWDRAHRERQERERRAELARRRREAEERRLEAERVRLERLNRPLNDTSASTAGVEGLFGMPTSNPDFLTSDPMVHPTIGELEREYILSVLGMAEESQLESSSNTAE